MSIRSALGDTWQGPPLDSTLEGNHWQGGLIGVEGACYVECSHYESIDTAGRGED